LLHERKLDEMRRKGWKNEFPKPSIYTYQPYLELILTDMLLIVKYNHGKWRL